MPETLLILGALLTVAAIAGDKVKGGSWEIPGSKSGVTRIAIGVVGLAMLVAACAIYLDSRRTSTPLVHNTTPPSTVQSPTENVLADQNSTRLAPNEQMRSSQNVSVATAIGNGSIAFSNSPVNGSITVGGSKQ